MPPRKQPTSLFDIAVRATIITINKACLNLFHGCHQYEFPCCQQKILDFRNYLFETLPSRIFDILCTQRRYYALRVDPRMQLCVLAHPRITSFVKADTDNCIQQSFWIEFLPSLTRLVVLDLKLICTDEILKVVAANCPLLEEINAVSRVDLRKSPFNASMLIRNVSDEGLSHIVRLQRLRLLCLDPPRNERISLRLGHCISQRGLRRVVAALPVLEELRVESCDVASALTAESEEAPRGPLTLRKLSCHFASPESVHRLLILCPHLVDLTLTHLSGSDKDDIIKELTQTEVNLERIDLSFFTFSYSMIDYLKVKGAYLTNFSLYEMESSLTLESILILGECCPNMTKLRLITHSSCLVVPPNFRSRSGPVFTKLESLTLGSDHFNIENVLVFFLSHAENISWLTIKYEPKIDMSEMLMRLVERGLLRSLAFLWLDLPTLLPLQVVKHIIDNSPLLKNIIVNFIESENALQTYIKLKNYDLKVDSNY